MYGAGGTSTSTVTAFLLTICCALGNDCRDLASKGPLAIQTAAQRASEYARNGDDAGSIDCEAVVFRFSMDPFQKSQSAWTLGTANLTGVGVSRNELNGVLLYRTAVRYHLEQAHHAVNAGRSSRISALSSLNRKAYTTGRLFEWGDAPPPPSDVYSTTNERGEITGTYQHEGLHTGTNPLPRKEFVYAYVLYSIAASTGYAAATERRRALSLSLTTDQIVRAQELATIIADNKLSDDAIASRFAKIPRAQQWENNEDIRAATAAQERGAKDDAFRRFKAAADQGLAVAQASVGYLILTSSGGSKNLAEYVHWTRRAAEQGLPAAQYNLAVAYAKGEGVIQSHTEAATWMRKAAERGFAYAQNSLGSMYVAGLGVTKNAQAAHNWFLLAASQGIVDAQHYLGVEYRSGQVVPRDYVRAYVWFALAAQREFPLVRPQNSSEKAKRECAGLLTLEQIRMADDIVRGWKPTVGVTPNDNVDFTIPSK
jgi:TPR repeat protein